MSYQVYDIVCKECKGQNRVGIDHDNRSVNWISENPIISARYRFDRQWGFECRCGNKSITTPEEDRFWADKSQAPKEQEMKQITDNLKQHKPKFEMRSA